MTPGAGSTGLTCSPVRYYCAITDSIIKIASMKSSIYFHTFMDAPFIPFRVFHIACISTTLRKFMNEKRVDYFAIYNSPAFVADNILAPLRFARILCCHQYTRLI